MDDGTTKDYCDCSTAHEEDKSYAGRYCEAESTSFCTKMPDHNGHQVSEDIYSMILSYKWKHIGQLIAHFERTNYVLIRTVLCER
jgi:hypothetical protein